FSMIFFLEISMSTYFFILAFLVLIQAAAGVVRGYSTKSIIPIFEQVATYEKEKMGIEWKKQRKTSIASSFFVSIVMFLNAMMSLEIGRATCRERVEYCVVSVELKRKKKH